MPPHPARGVDPDLVERLAAECDRRVAEMFALVKDDRPATGAKAARLLMIARLLKGHLEKFEAEAERAL